MSGSGGNPGHGWGNPYHVTAAGTYLISPIFIPDAYVGRASPGTHIHTPGIDQQVGLTLK